jgi:hypothetical protein
MYLLLQGPSAIARISLAEKIVKKRDDWRHIPVEHILDMIELEGNTAALGALFEEETLLPLAIQCAQKMGEENLHSVISCEDATGAMQEMHDELGETFYAIHIGPDDELAAMCDFVIDEKKSVNDAYDLMNQLIEKVLEASS